MDREMVERLYEKQERMSEDMVEVKLILNEHKFILSENTRILDEHQKRTRVSEDRLQQMEEVFYRHLNFVRGATYVISALFGATGIVVGLLKLFS